MKAMILAAGLGTRLKPLTDHTPKALVEVEGTPMLERIILNLKRQGFDEIFVNVHHLAHRIIKFLAEKDFGLEITVSDESEKLLDTGGGIVKAAPLIFKNDDKPVLIHNVDILSNADLSRLMKESKNRTTLLVSDRVSSRKLIFNQDMELKGWHDLRNDTYLPKDFSNVPSDIELAFSGIYVLHKSSVEEMEKLKDDEAFPIMNYFLDPGRKDSIQGAVQDNLRILDIGKPDTLRDVSEFLSRL